MLLCSWFDQSQLKTKGALRPALFLGAAMSITAFPVLARIIAECGMQKSRLGATAIACAAIQDFLAWCILVLVVAVVTTSRPCPLARITIESAAFVLGLIYLVRPDLAWLLAPGRRWAGNSLTVHAVLICGLLACAWATDAIGLHTVFGVFAFGTVVPRGRIDALVPQVPERIDQTSLLLLPVFFTVTGLSVDLGGLGGRVVLMVAAVIVVACVGKFVGAAGAAKLSGQTGREAATLAILLNARGLTELIILGIGLRLGVLDQRLYTAMVVMAIVTTLMTGPLVRRMHREPAPPQTTERQVRITHDEEIPRSSQSALTKKILVPNGGLNSNGRSDRPLF
jgi:Kef-type K+ transport system membrane component KefB